MTKKKAAPHKFQKGDRVAERPKATAIPGLNPKTLSRISEYRSQRYGVVVDVFIKPTKTKAGVTNSKFVKVLWDGLQTPSDHAQMRLIHENELETLLEEYRAGIGG